MNDPKEITVKAEKVETPVPKRPEMWVAMAWNPVVDGWYCEIRKTRDAAIRWPDESDLAPLIIRIPAEDEPEVPCDACQWLQSKLAAEETQRDAAHAKIAKVAAAIEPYLLELAAAGRTGILATDAVGLLVAEREELRQRKDLAYSERNHVVVALAKCAIALGYRVGTAKTAIEGWSEDWHGCIYLDLSTGQVSWHYHDSIASLFAAFPAYEGKWDGHNTVEKYERLDALTTDSILATAERDELKRKLAEAEKVLGRLRDEVKFHKNPIIVHCPQCGRTAISPREDYDPQTAVQMDIECTDCGVGNKPEPTYRDAMGMHIMEDPAALAARLISKTPPTPADEQPARDEPKAGA